MEKCIGNGAQRVLSAATEFANDLRVEFWFCGVKRVWNVECHFDCEAHTKTITIMEKNVDLCPCTI